MFNILSEWAQNRNHVIISVDAMKTFEIFHYLFMTKDQLRLRIKETYLNIIKAVYDKATANTMVNGTKLKPLPPNSKVIQTCSSTTLVQYNY